MPGRLFAVCMLLGATVALRAQSDISFPKEEYYGGGIGYTPMFLFYDLAKNLPFNATNQSDDTGLLEAAGLNFSQDDIDGLGKMLVIHGAEGFGNITGNWRVGAYVGLGSKSISTLDTTGSQSETELQVSFSTGSASAEYVIPVFSNLELAGGSLFGVSRTTVQISRSSSTPFWEDQFSGSDSNNTMTTLSGTYFSIQPYIAVKLQFLDRAGLRISAGYNIGNLPANKWMINGLRKIKAPSTSTFNALAVRIMLYLGI